MSEVKCYKIRNKDGLFSRGGTSPSWSKKGKVWASKQAVMAHLAQFVDTKHYKQKKFYSETDEIVEMIVSTEEGSVMSVEEEFNRLQKNRSEKEVKQEATWAVQKLERAKQELERAKANFLKLTEKG